MLRNLAHAASASSLIVDLELLVGIAMPVLSVELLVGIAMLALSVELLAGIATVELLVLERRSPWS